GLGSRRDNAGEGDAAGRSNHLRDLIHGGQNGVVVIVLPQEGNHGSADIAGTGVINYGLQPIPDFNAIAALGWRDQDKDASVVLFAADPQVLVKVDSIIFDRLALERLYGDYANLRLGLLFDLEGEGFQLLFRRGIDDSGKIGDIALGVNVGNLLRASNGRDQEDDNESHADAMMSTQLNPQR